MTAGKTASLASVCAAKAAAFAAEPKILSCSTNDYYNKPRGRAQGLCGRFGGNFQEFYKEKPCGPGRDRTAGR